MTLKTRLTAMMVLLLMAVIVLQYLLGERERRALEKRLAELSSHVNFSTRLLAERSHVLSRSFPELDPTTILQRIDADSLPAGLRTDASYEIVVFATSEGEIPERDLLRERIETEQIVRGDSSHVRESLHVRTIRGPRDSLLVFQHWSATHKHESLGAVPRVRRPWFPWVVHDSSLARVPATTDVVVNLPLPSSAGDSMYALRVRYPFEDLTDELSRARTRSLAWLGALLGIGVVGAFLMSNQLTRPIRSLQASFGRVQSGDLSVEVQPERRDEIGQLTSSFNEMVARLKETREMEARLAESEHLASLGRLAAGVAHEVRNPLNAILLSMQQMRDRVANAKAADGDFERYYDVVTGEIARLERMVSTFLDLSRVNELALEDLDAVEGLATCIDLYRPEAAAKEATIESRLPQSVVIHADPVRLPHVWNNLLSNAVAAVSLGGRIEVEARVEAEELQVEVRDDGNGIDAATLHRIWEPFFSGRADGSGLGLSIVRSVVRAHGGDASVDSRPGSGSCFAVRLPLRARAATVTETAKQEGRA